MMSAAINAAVHGADRVLAFCRLDSRPKEAVGIACRRYLYFERVHVLYFFAAGLHKDSRARCQRQQSDDNFNVGVRTR